MLVFSTSRLGYPVHVFKTHIVDVLQAKVPRLMAVYAFGSRIQGNAGLGSDLDLAVLVGGYADTWLLWCLAGELAVHVGCEVDLLDLRAASTVMQYQILTTGERWWASDIRVGLFEVAVLSEKTALDEARAGLFADIQARGSVYGQ